MQLTGPSIAATNRQPTGTPETVPATAASGLWHPATQLRAGALAGVLLLLGAILDTATDLTIAPILVWFSLLIGLVYGVQAALAALAERKVDIDVLMVVGAGLAAGIGHPAEGALLLFLFTLSGALEDLAFARTVREIEALHTLMPVEALVWRDQTWAEVAPESLQVGERIKIRPGERVPTDAGVLEGVSSLDQSTLTGESLPRRVAPGDEIYAGTVNLDSALEATVTRPASESSLQRVLKLVTEAREQREPIQRLIDRMSEPYAWAVLSSSAVVMLVWWLALGRTAAESAYVAITFLIVMSPCALIIATPTATLSAISRGARQGVLFKGGQALERLARINALCFDKTGTLTAGRPSVDRLEPVGWSDPQRLLAVAAALEADSTHPIARAVIDAAARQRVAPAQGVRVTEHAAGQGVKGDMQGEPVAVGTWEFAHACVPVCLRARTREILQSVQQSGAMGAVIGAGGDTGPHGAAAVIALRDAVRPAARRLVRELHQLNIRPIRMLTGDNHTTAQHVARQVGIDECFADLLPEDKVRLVREMRTAADNSAGRTPRRVAFVGDGVNDAPALAAADVSIAIGSIGSDAALESADIVLLSDDLACVSWAVALARRARAILRFNIALAMTVIAGMGLATLAQHWTGVEIPMSVGVIAHEGGTLLVVMNSLRLLWPRGVRQDQPT